jgi:hypothetical protein
MAKFWLMIATLIASNLSARPIEIVMIDQAAETELGKFPIDRAHIAAAIEAIERAGARAIILKLFFDQPRSAASDERLANALRTKIPIVLQARVDDTESKSNPLPSRFFLPEHKVAPSAAFSGRNGWLPLPSLAAHATAVGFIDALNPAPIVEVYRGKTVPSLFLIAAELMLGQKVTVAPNTRIRVGARELLEDFGHELRRPHADFLCDGIYELRFRLGRVNHRILYFFHGRTAAVLSSGFTKEAEVPRIKIERASERKRKFWKNPEAHTYRGSET